MKLSDEELRRSVKLLAKAELEQWHDYEDYPEPAFSEQFHQKMYALLNDVQANKVKQDRTRMGWLYYSKRVIVAVLLCFLLSYAIMPEAVLASCHQIIEVVRAVFEEYTEYHITSREASDIQLVPVTLKYLPEGIQEVEREEHPTTLRVVYQDNAGQNVLILRQEIFKKGAESDYIVDTEDAQTEYYTVQNEQIQIITKEDRIQFIWKHGDYLITGQTKLPKEEILLILQNI